VTVFRARSFKEVIKLRETVRGALVHLTGALIKEKSDTQRDTRDTHAQTEDHTRCSGRRNHCRQRREAVGETSPAGTFILNFQTPGP
jgi:hypothetical protein